LYKEGVDKSDPYAYYLLGQCLLRGKGLAQDIAEGTRLIAQSAQMDDPWGKLYMLDANRFCCCLVGPY